jgi:nucleoid-associated protein YejK
MSVPKNFYSPNQKMLKTEAVDFSHYAKEQDKKLEVVIFGNKLRFSSCRKFLGEGGLRKVLASNLVNISDVDFWMIEDQNKNTLYITRKTGDVVEEDNPSTNGLPITF